MSREIKRVPLDFDWPLRKVWSGYLMPEHLHENKCPDCKNGYSPQAQHLFDLWYGYIPFSPESNGSVRLTPGTPAVRAFAERNVANSPGYYGTGESAILREACRLADLWNSQWCHHVNAGDVAALVEAGRLMDFTHTWSPEARWQKIEPPVIPTPEQVNDWAIRTMGHDAINASVVVGARCKREGQPEVCATCDGHSGIEAYPGQRTEAEAWKETEPPTGEGWQLWETVSEGSPISPVFADADGLAHWLASESAGRDQMPLSAAQGFVSVGWAPTGIGNAGGMHKGAEYVGTEKVLADLDPGDGTDGARR